MRKSALRNCAKKRIKASTMIEVLVAFVICMIIFTLSMRFILQVELNSPLALRQKAAFLVRSKADLENLADKLNTSATTENYNLLIRTDTVITSINTNINRVDITITDTNERLLGKTSFLLGRRK